MPSKTLYFVSGKKHNLMVSGQLASTFFKTFRTQSTYHGVAFRIEGKHRLQPREDQPINVSQSQPRRGSATQDALAAAAPGFSDSSSSSRFQLGSCDEQDFSQKLDRRRSNITALTGRSLLVGNAGRTFQKESTNCDRAQSGYSRYATRFFIGDMNVVTDTGAKPLHRIPLELTIKVQPE